MSRGIKPHNNRVRASNALQVTGIWANTIGVEQEMGGNTAIEDALYGPQKHGGRKERQQRAQELMQAAGYQPSVTDYEGLKALAKAAGGGTANRGACKVCGGLGHLTKQCRNLAAAAAAAEGREESLAARAALPLLTEADDADALELLTSGSDSDASGSDERRDKKRKRRGSSGKRGGGKDKRDKKEKRSRKEKHSKKRTRRERSRSPP